MLTRIVTALIAIPFLLYIIISGGLILELSIILVAMIGVKEIYDAFSKEYKPLKKSGYLFALLFLISSLYSRALMGITLGLLIIGILMIMVFKYPKYSIIDISVTVFGALYIVCLFPFIYFTRAMPRGEFFVWIIFISAWGTDTCAYFAGSLLGKHKLAPALSPNKTIEGAVGGVIGAAILGLIYTWAWGVLYDPLVLDYLLLVPVMTALSSGIAQLGDLSASAMKRYLHVKDFGYILPGHGGVLDRFDSVLFTAPFVYAVLYILF